MERGLEVYRTVFEKYKVECKGYAGPAVVEVFGEEPFLPKTKEEALKLSDKQQQLMVYQRGAYGQLMNQYIIGEERSFTRYWSVTRDLKSPSILRKIPWCQEIYYLRILWI